MRFAAALTLTAVLLATPALAADLTVPIDHTTRVSLSGSAASVVVGNSSVVDAVVLDRRNILLVGRGYGVTNVMVMDGAGRTVFNKVVQVSSAAPGRVTLFRGATPNTYACSPRCERTPMPGEPSAAFDPYNGPVATYQGRASGSTPAASDDAAP